jgi:hypothetical protein
MFGDVMSGGERVSLQKNWGFRMEKFLREAGRFAVGISNWGSWKSNSVSGVSCFGGPLVRAVGFPVGL